MYFCICVCRSLFIYLVSYLFRYVIRSFVISPCRVVRSFFMYVCSLCCYNIYFFIVIYVCIYIVMCFVRYLICSCSFLYFLARYLLIELLLYVFM